jgi:hypothetical protein
MKCIVVCTLFATVCSFAEDTYRLRFRMEQSTASGAKADARSYILLLQNKTRGSIDATRRIPYYNGKELHTVAVGNLIECTANSEDTGVRLDCNLESSFVAPDQPASAQPFPVIRSRRIKTNALAPIAREFRIARLDDPATGTPLEVFVLAERFTGPIDANK